MKDKINKSYLNKWNLLYSLERKKYYYILECHWFVILIKTNAFIIHKETDIKTTDAECFYFW